MTTIKTTIAPHELREALLRAVRRTDTRLCGKTLSSTDRYALAIGEELEKEPLWQALPKLYEAACAALEWFETNEAKLPGSCDVAPDDQLRDALRQADA